MTNETTADAKAVEDFLASIDDAKTVADSRVLIAMMSRVSGHAPKLWNVGTLGFGSYHYRYESGREGDAQTIGFYPRKGKITVYLMDGTAPYSELLGRLGKHSTSRVCVYLKRLADVELPVLEEIVRRSYENVKAQDGRMQRVVE